MNHLNKEILMEKKRFEIQIGILLAEYNLNTNINVFNTFSFLYRVLILLYVDLE